MQNFTLDENARFSNNEIKWLNELTNAMNNTHTASLEPSADVLSRISAYNKAYSNRSSKMVGSIEMLLN